jgi:hypothetical protein
MIKIGNLANEIRILLPKAGLRLSYRSATGRKAHLYCVISRLSQIE